MKSILLLIIGAGLIVGAFWLAYTIVKVIYEIISELF